ncbi:MAG TPA: multicopper oxidase domain-containing protein [Anaerolineae bacterium]|nr:multicopper oxidase domain-containing protein [Anaerolineae bacterium]
MISRNFTRYFARLGLIAVLVCTTFLTAGSDTTSAQQATWPVAGVICTTNATATFTLTTQEGYIYLPDGNVVYMWGLSEGNNPFQHPSPVLCVNEGDTVTVVLHNTLPEAISLIFPGQADVLANGAPAQPQFDAGGNLVSLAQTAAASGGSVTYSFVASKPGTFLYESGTDALKQVNMGLFGALIVRPALNNPANGETYAYNDATTRYKPSTEFILILSELDPMLHAAVEMRQPYDLSQYHVRYWLINGRSFPDTIAGNGAAWLPDQPYSSLVYIHPLNTTAAPSDPAYNPYPALMRYVNVTTEDQSWHPHGNHQRVIAQDSNLLVGPGGVDLSYEKFAVLIGPGQTWDMLFDWRDAENWDPVTNPIPVTIPQLQNLVPGPFYSGSPYLGNLDTLPVGTQALNQCGEYYHIAHSHQLQKITAWGMVLSGYITFSRIDPPLPNQCP